MVPGVTMSQVVPKVVIVLREMVESFPMATMGFSRRKPLIFKCGSFCCCPPSCRNRVSQKSMKHQLEVFRSRETGWGVRSLDLIPAGDFICEYIGIVLTTTPKNSILLIEWPMNGWESSLFATK